ncbi:hypothetical protein DESA109040_01305 [Deinococcus saxicola]
MKLAAEYLQKARQMEARTRLIFENIIQNQALSGEQLRHATNPTPQG